MGYWGMMLFGYYEMEMDIIDYCFSGILSFSSFFNPSDWLLSLIAIMHTLLLQIACSNHFGHSNRQHICSFMAILVIIILGLFIEVASSL